VLEQNLNPSKQILCLLQTAIADLSSHNEKYSLSTPNGPFVRLCVALSTAEFFGGSFTVPQELSAHENRKSLNSLHSTYTSALARCGVELSYTTIDPYVGNPDQDQEEGSTPPKDATLKAEGSEIHFVILDTQTFKSTLSQLVTLHSKDGTGYEVISHLAEELYLQLSNSEAVHSNQHLETELRELGYELLSLFSKANVESSTLVKIAQLLPK
jgi:hypothetical protein